MKKLWRGVLLQCRRLTDNGRGAFEEGVKGADPLKQLRPREIPELMLGKD
jgi:hypothetical protein